MNSNHLQGVQSTLCKEKNKVCSRMGALVIIKSCLGIPIDPDDIPLEMDGEEVQGWDTIVSASVVRALGDVEVEKDI